MRGPARKECCRCVPSVLRAFARSHHFAALAAAILCLARSTPSCAAGSPNVDTIIRMKLALEPAKPSIRTMSMTFDDHVAKTTFGEHLAEHQLVGGATRRGYGGQLR